MLKDAEPARDPLEAATEERARSSWSRLLLRGGAGDRAAVEALFARVMPVLRRWAHGRLPRWARGLSDTADVVQDVLLKSLHRLGHIQPQGQAALQAYLRQAVNNRIRDEMRRVGRRPRPEELGSDHAESGPSPLDQVVEAEGTRRYLQALARLREEDRQLVVARLELDYSYEQLALLGSRTPDGARMAVRRAVMRLAEEMSRE